MSKKKWIVIIISLVLVIGVSVGAYVYFFTNAFKPLLSEVLGYEGKTITRIAIFGGEEYYNTTVSDDTEEIEMVLDAFKDVKVVGENYFNFTGLTGCPEVITLYSGDEEIAVIEYYGTTVNLRAQNKQLTLDRLPSKSASDLVEYFFSAERNQNEKVNKIPFPG